MIYIPGRIDTRDDRENLPNLQSDINLIYQNKIVISLLDSFPLITLLLNNFRQILYCNRAYLELTSADPRELVLGLRPGELFGCAYHEEAVKGCGEAEHCRYCGAVAAIRESQSKRETITKEARLTIIREKQEISVDFKVTASPIELFNSHFSIVSLEDISDSKRRKYMERIFFHDIIDKASCIQFAVDSTLKYYSSEKGKEFATISQRLNKELLSEILGQRVLLNAENKELAVNLSKINSLEIIQRTIEQIKNHQISGDKEIITGNNNYNCEMVTDYLLLNRILINMLKNALEASIQGEKVTISCSQDAENVVFSVHNQLEMTDAIKIQIFQRSFSTKGENRGIGTYSMKLLGEKYLKGKVWFESTAEKGTLFYLSVPQILLTD